MPARKETKDKLERSFLLLFDFSIKKKKITCVYFQNIEIEERNLVYTLEFMYFRMHI